MLTLAVGLCKYRFVKICHSLTFCVKISKLENKNFFQGKELSFKNFYLNYRRKSEIEGNNEIIGSRFNYTGFSQD